MSALDLLRPLSLVALVTCALAACQGPTVPATAPQVPGELLMKFRAPTSEAARAAVRVQAGVTSYRELLPGIECWEVADPAAVMGQVGQDARLEYVQPNYLRHVQGFVAPELQDSTQWYLDATRGIDVASAWARFGATATDSAPGAGVLVAVVDTGIDITHPDLKDRIATDSQGPRFIDCVGPDYSPYAGSTNFEGKDGNGHGTHVAGILAASAGQGGIVGVAPGATLLPVKVMQANGDGNDDAIARGLIAAADAGADVINLSVGGPLPSPVLADALAYDMARGSTVVIASGNGGEAVYYPAACAGVIAVGATTGASADPTAIAYYSDSGPELALVAPGGDDPTGKDPTRGIYSTLPTYPCYLSLVYQKYVPAKSPYGVQVGTSMATPIVSGVAALVIAEAKAHGQHLSPAQVRTRLLATARPLAAGGFSAAAGYGMVDPVRALAATAGGPL